MTEKQCILPDGGRSGGDIRVWIAQASGGDVVLMHR